MDDYVQRLLEFARSFSDRAKSQLSMTQKCSGPESRPGRVSDVWPLGGGILLILSGVAAFLLQNAC
jgi:hypothetical protein